MDLESVLYDLTHDVFKNTSYEKYSDVAVEALKIFKGMVVPVSPLNTSDMAIANRLYLNRIEHLLSQIDSHTRAKSINQIIHVLRAHEYHIRLLEENDKVLMNLVDNICNARDSAESNLLGLGSSTLKGLSGLLWTIPGVNVVWGTAAYAGGILLDYYAESETASTIKESLAQAKMLLLDNIVVAASHEKIDLILNKADEIEQKDEIVTNWLEKKEEEMYDAEDIVLRSRISRNLFYGFSFYALFSSSERILDRTKMGVIVPIALRRRTTIHYLAIDLIGNTVIKGSNMTLQTDIAEIERVLKSMLLGNKRGEWILKCTSQTPFMVGPEILESLIDKLDNRFMRHLPLDYDDASSTIHAFLQSSGITQ